MSERTGLLARMLPPAVRPVVPPGQGPSRAQTTYESLLEKPSSLTEAGITDAGSLQGPLSLHSNGVPPLELQRDDTAAAVMGVVEIKRHGTVLGYIGIDASDRIAILKSDGTTVLLFIETNGTVNAGLAFKATKFVDSGGNQVVSARGAAIVDAATSAASGSATATTGTVAAASPPTKAEFDALVAVVNGNAAATNLNANAINSIVTTLNAIIAKFNSWLARARAHGLIAP